MSRSSNKRGVFNTIGAYTSMNQQGKPPKQIDSFSSINTKNEPIGFLLDIIKTVAGGDVLRTLMGGLITTVVVQSETSLKSVLKKQVIKPSADDEFPNSLTNNGMDIPVKDIDSGGKLKIPPTSQEGGSLLYGEPSSNNFDRNAYDTITKDGQVVSSNNLSMRYDSDTDNFNFKPDNNGVPIKSGTFFENYVNSTTLLNKNEILANVFDSVYGTINNAQNRAAEEILEQLMLEKMLEKLLDGDDSFELTDEEIDELTKRAEEIANGIINESMGCGLVSTKLSMGDLNSLIADISGSTDQYTVGKKIGDAIDNSVKSVRQSSSSGQDASSEANSAAIIKKNKDSIRGGFIERIIKTIATKMLQAVTTAPQILVLFGMVSYMETGGNPTVGASGDNLAAFKKIIKCLAKEILMIIGAYLFAIAMQYLVKLLTPIIKKIIKEKINQFKQMLLGLFGGGAVSDTIDSS